MKTEKSAIGHLEDLMDELSYAQERSVISREES